MIKSILYFSGWFLGIFLVSCSTIGPQYQPPETPLPSQWKQGLSPSTNTYKYWWAVFNDDELHRIQLVALEENFDLEKATLRVEESKAYEKVNQSKQLPTIDINSKHQYQKDSKYAAKKSSDFTSPSNAQDVDDEKNSTRATLDVNYEIDLWGKIKRTLEASQAETEAYQAARNWVEIMITSDVATHYFNIRTMDQKIKIQNQRIDFQKRIGKLRQKRHQEGFNTGLEIHQNESDLSKNQKELDELKRKRQRDENAIAQLCGIPASQFSLQPQDNAIPSPPSISPGIPSDLLIRRPDILEAERWMASRCAQIGITQARYLPSIQLTGLAGFQSVDLRDLLNWQSRLWSIGPSIQIPLFSGGKKEAELNIAWSQYHQAIAEYRQKVIQVFQQVENSLTDIHQFNQQNNSLNESQISLLKMKAEYEIRQEKGFTSKLQSIDTEISLFELQKLILENQNNLYLSTIQLIKALGGGWSSS